MPTTTTAAADSGCLRLPLLLLLLLLLPLLAPAAAATLAAAAAAVAPILSRLSPGFLAAQVLGLGLGSSSLAAWVTFTDPGKWGPQLQGGLGYLGFRFGACFVEGVGGRDFRV